MLAYVYVGKRWHHAWMKISYYRLRCEWQWHSTIYEMYDAQKNLYRTTFFRYRGGIDIYVYIYYMYDWLDIWVQISSTFMMRISQKIKKKFNYVVLNCWCDENFDCTSPYPVAAIWMYVQYVTFRLLLSSIFELQCHIWLSNINGPQYLKLWLSCYQSPRCYNIVQQVSGS
jgi:hypothetical protein